MKKKIAGKLVDDTEQVSGKRKLLCVKREQNPITKVSKRMKSSNFRLFFAYDFMPSYASDITNIAIQNPR